MNEKKISFTINGTKLNRTVEVHRTLVEFIRDGLGLTGTKEGCDEGECGACTVLFDGKPIHSCCTLAVEIDGHEIVTIEGLSRMGTKAMTCLDPIQQAFVDVGAWLTPNFFARALSTSLSPGRYLRLIISSISCSLICSLKTLFCSFSGASVVFNVNSFVIIYIYIALYRCHINNNFFKTVCFYKRFFKCNPLPCRSVPSVQKCPFHAVSGAYDTLSIIYHRFYYSSCDTDVNT